MPYKILDEGDVVEVHVNGTANKWEVFEALQTLQKNDPLKARSDLWLIASESMLPYETFPSIIETAKKLCSPGMVGKPTAIVSTDEMMHAALQIYQQEAVAGNLPFEIRVFRDRDSALSWLRN